jgi:hypothetical protein
MAHSVYESDGRNSVYELEDHDTVTPEDLEARLDELQTQNEFLVERLRHIEHTLVLCFMLLLLIIVINLQLISVADIKDTGEQFWEWLKDWVS